MQPNCWAVALRRVRTTVCRWVQGGGARVEGSSGDLRGLLGTVIGLLVMDEANMQGLRRRGGGIIGWERERGKDRVRRAR